MSKHIHSCSPEEEPFRLLKALQCHQAKMQAEHTRSHKLTAITFVEQACFTKYINQFNFNGHMTFSVFTGSRFIVSPTTSMALKVQNVSVLFVPCSL